MFTSLIQVYKINVSEINRCNVISPRNKVTRAKQLRTPFSWYRPIDNALSPTWNSGVGRVRWEGIDRKHYSTRCNRIADNHAYSRSFILSLSLSLVSKLPRVRARVQVAVRGAACPAFHSFIIVVSARHEQWCAWTPGHHEWRGKAVGIAISAEELTRAVNQILNASRSFLSAFSLDPRALYLSYILYLSNLGERFMQHIL